MRTALQYYAHMGECMVAQLIYGMWEEVEGGGGGREGDVLSLFFMRSGTTSTLFELTQERVHAAVLV